MSFDANVLITAARERAVRRGVATRYTLMAETFRRRAMLDACLMQLTQRAARKHPRYCSTRLGRLIRRIYFLLQPLVNPFTARLALRAPQIVPTTYALALCQIRWQVEWEAHLTKQLETIQARLDELAAHNAH